MRPTGLKCKLYKKQSINTDPNAAQKRSRWPRSVCLSSAGRSDFHAIGFAAVLVTWKFKNGKVTIYSWCGPWWWNVLITECSRNIYFSAPKLMSRAFRNLNKKLIPSSSTGEWNVEKHPQFGWKGQIKENVTSDHSVGPSVHLHLLGYKPPQPSDVFCWF